MNFYIIKRISEIEAPCPDKLPKAGEIYKFSRNANTKRASYKTGDELKLIRRTQKNPHGFLSSLGNWVVEDKFGRSVWSNIEWMIAEGNITKVK